MKRIILANQPLYLDDNTIVIDHGSKYIWLGLQHFPKECRPNHPTVFRVLAVLLARMERLVLWNELIDYVYAEQVDGGPMDCGNVVKVTICRASQIFSQLGVYSTTHYGWGCQLNWRDGQMEPDVV